MTFATFLLAVWSALFPQAIPFPGPGGTSSHGTPVTIDNHCSAAVSTSTSNSCSMTVSASAKSVAIFVSGYTSAAGVTGVTVAGASASVVCSRLQSGNTTAQIWFLSSPPTGLVNIVVTWQSGTFFQTMAGESYTGGSGSWQNCTATGNFSTTSSSVSVSSAVNHLVVDDLAVGNCLSATISPSQSQIYNSGCNSVNGGGSSAAGSSSVTMAWAISAARDNAQVAIDIF